jgi:hypothetical protein
MIPVNGVEVVVIVIDADGVMVEVIADAPANVMSAADKIVPAKPDAEAFNVNAPADCVSVPVNEPPVLTSNEVVPVEAMFNADAAVPATTIDESAALTLAVNGPTVGANVNTTPEPVTNEPVNDPDAALVAIVAVDATVIVLLTDDAIDNADEPALKPPFTVIAPEYEPVPVNANVPPDD